MKLEAVFPPNPPASRSATGMFAARAACLLVIFLLSASSAQAADANPLDVVRKLAKEGVKCPIYVEEVVKLVKAYPKQADEIIAEAVKNQPPCACEIVKAGIAAMTPLNGTPDPKQVASMVALVVQYIQTTNPDLLETIVACATEAAPEAGPQILAAISQVMGVSQTTAKQQGALITGMASPTATPKPPTTPIPVTPVVPP